MEINLKQSRQWTNKAKFEQYQITRYLFGEEQGASREMKLCAFHIPCEMQRSLDLLHPNYTKEREKQARTRT